MQRPSQVLFGLFILLGASGCLYGKPAVEHHAAMGEPGARVLFMAGRDSHGPRAHEHEAGTRLLIAADGRSSPMREAAGISVSTQRYGQKALAFTVSHPVPHDNISTEIHRTGGPWSRGRARPDRRGRRSRKSHRCGASVVANGRGQFHGACAL